MAEAVNKVKIIRNFILLIAVEGLLILKNRIDFCE
jgi:hypothetical protein